MKKCWVRDPIFDHIIVNVFDSLDWDNYCDLDVDEILSLNTDVIDFRK